MHRDRGGGPIRPGDEELLDLLRSALAAADPVPDAVLRGAEWAASWRTVDADLDRLDPRRPPPEW